MPEETRQSTHRPDPTLDEQLESILRDQLAEGFWTHAQVLDFAIKVLSDRYEGVQERAEAVWPRVVAERERDMAAWPAVTDCDRLDAAFEELNAMGILARHNWWCCGGCGAGAMPAEAERLGGKWEGVPIVGYAFYHWQNTEGAVEGSGLCLSYGICREETNAEVWMPEEIEIGRRVMRVLEKHGLKVDWNGSLSRRIKIRMVWQRRSKPERFCEVGGT